MFGSQLVKKVKIEQRRRFNNWLNQGHHLSFEEIKSLNPEWKEDYIKYIKDESESVRKYVAKKIEEVEKRNEQLSHLAMDVHEVIGEFHHHV